MAPEERRLAASMAGAAVVFFVVFWRPWEGGARLAFAAFGVAFAAALGATAWWGNRVFCALAAFVLGVFGPWYFLSLLGAAYVGLAAWIGLRASRAARPSDAPATPPRRRSGRVTPKRRGPT
jgi:hypothetical protein